MHVYTFFVGVTLRPDEIMYGFELECSASGRSSSWSSKSSAGWRLEGVEHLLAAFEKEGKTDDRSLKSTSSAGSM